MYTIDALVSFFCITFSSVSQSLRNQSFRASDAFKHNATVLDPRRCRSFGGFWISCLNIRLNSVRAIRQVHNF
jgi:hypothetical protein